MVSLSARSQERYFTIWNKNAISVQPWDNITLGVAQKIHYSTDKNAVVLKYGELNIAHEPKKWLEYGAAFRLSYLSAKKGVWYNENRPMAFISLSKDLNMFELSFSNRLEYRMFTDFEDYFRHKQALKLDFPNLVSWGLSFYLSEESYLELNGGGTHLARFYSGVKAIDKDHFEMKLYYSLEKVKALNSWVTGDIMGLNLTLSI